MAIEKDAANRIRGVITESKSGRQAWRGNTIIDTTGDGDVGALAGCQCEFGQKNDCPCQPMSLMGVITASPEALQRFDTASAIKNKDRFREERTPFFLSWSFCEVLLRLANPFDGRFRERPQS